MIYTIKNVSNLAREVKGKKVVFSAGCFDLLHQGHVDFLKKLRRYGEKVIILVKPDNYIISNKSRKPVHNQKVRALIVDSLKYVDHAILVPSNLLKNEPQVKILKNFKSGIYVTRDKRWKKFFPKLQDINFKLIIMNSNTKNSSSKIIKLINKNQKSRGADVAK